MQMINRSQELQLLYILCQLAIAQSSRSHKELPGEKIKRLLKSDYWKESTTNEKLALLKSHYEPISSFTHTLNNQIAM